MNFAIIIQARTGSKRFPKKILNFNHVKNNLLRISAVYEKN